jgi:diguanylate cyclase (GGDEF)-like protein
VLILQVGEALAEAHEKGIVHRDVKPANILVDVSGAPRLTDFDLVAAEDTTGGTRTGAMGSFLFTAPEQMGSSRDADARADVYGLGMTAVFTLHGKGLPMIVVRRPERVIAALQCDESVKQVLTRAIEFEPGERFADARQFCEALREANGSPGVKFRIKARAGRDRDETGLLWARRHLLTDLAIAILAATKGAPLSIAFLDMNGLKSINDTHGHDAGDEAIRAFFQTVAATLGQVGEVYRNGGDEVVAILPGADDARARKLLDALVRQLGKNVLTLGISKVDMRLTVSCGSASIIDPNEDAQKLLTRVDEVQYRAKVESKKHDPRVSTIALGDSEVIVHDPSQEDATRAAEGSPIKKLLQSTFISYGAPDEPFARRLYEALHRNGVTTFFFPEHAKPGQRIGRVVRENVGSYDRIVLLCSKASLDRKGVLYEIEETLERERRDGAEYLIPIELDDCLRSEGAVLRKDLVRVLRDRVCADFRDTQEDEAVFQASLQKLIAALRRPDLAPWPPPGGTNVVRLTYRILTLGINGVGKTALTAKWANPLVDLGTLQGTKIERYGRTVSHVVMEGVTTEHVFEIGDWGGEHIVEAQQEFAMEEIHGLLIVVDLGDKGAVQPERIQEQLREFQPQSLKYFFGAKMVASCKTVVLFINKSDLIPGPRAEAEAMALDLYSKLIKDLEVYKEKVDIRVLVGSASYGYATHHLFSHFVEKLLPQSAYDNQLIERIKRGETDIA